MPLVKANESPCNPAIQRKATQYAAYREFSLSSLITNTRRKKTVHVFENTLKTGF
jgi:hypothetical protein